MPSTTHEIRNRRIVAAVVARFLRRGSSRTSAWSMDMLARLSILEGMAGVSPGEWLRKQARGFADANTHFEATGLHPQWTSASNQMVYSLAVMIANTTLGSADEGEELIQELVSGSSTSGGPRRYRIFYSIGETLKKYERDLAEISPQNRLVKGTLSHWVKRSAIDVLRARKTRDVGFAPNSEEGFDPTRSQPSGGELDDDVRANLILLALQSPGGPGAMVRNIIDHLVDKAFSPIERPIVRMFLQKIGEPKYRSPGNMREMVVKFDPVKWFTQAYNLVRKEIMDETGMSPQQLTNILGGNAARVFKFMQTVVGKDPKVQSTIEQLAEEIELLEPSAGFKLGKKQRSLLFAKLSTGSAGLSPEERSAIRLAYITHDRSRRSQLLQGLLRRAR